MRHPRYTHKIRTLCTKHTQDTGERSQRQMPARCNYLWMDIKGIQARHTSGQAQLRRRWSAQLISHMPARILVPFDATPPAESIPRLHIYSSPQSSLTCSAICKIAKQKAPRQVEPASILGFATFEICAAHFYSNCRQLKIVDSFGMMRAFWLVPWGE